ncbi:MAG: radical SAM protein [Bacteroidetes bacterium]|nr:radical SAM protein [Bacteroidota bacterium]
MADQQNILLISLNQFDKPYPVYPIGLSYLSTYLKERLSQYTIEMFDIYLDDFERLELAISELQPKYIGISLRNVDDSNSLNNGSFINSYGKIISKIRTLSDATIVIGGAGFSIFPEKLFTMLQPDFGICGEGEKSLYELINCLDAGSDYQHIEGLIYDNHKQIVKNKRGNYCQDLTLSFNDRLTDFYWQNSGMLSVQTQRGCPYQCIYCSYPVIEGKKIRTLNTDKILDSLSYLYYTKGVDYIFFTDSVFNIENEYNLELAEKIIQSGIKIRWGAYFTFKNLEEKLLIKLKQSGLTHLEFGTESLSDRVLKKYGKSFSVSEVLEKSEMCTRLGINFIHFIILAGYGETDETVNETFENSKRIGTTAFFPFVGMRIYPGTKLHDLAIEDGTISKDDDLIEPRYYISKDVETSTLKQRAKATGKNWIFPDKDFSESMKKFRTKNKKGPLWEYSLG